MTSSNGNIFQCQLIVNWILGNIFQWDFNDNEKKMVQENWFKNIFCEVVAILPIVLKDTVLTIFQLKLDIYHHLKKNPITMEKKGIEYIDSMCETYLT